MPTTHVPLWDWTIALGWNDENMGGPAYAGAARTRQRIAMRMPDQPTPTVRRSSGACKEYDRAMRTAWLVLLAACSGSSDSAQIDAPMPDAYDTARCLIKGDYGALGSVTGTAGNAQGNTTVT